MKKSIAVLGTTKMSIPQKIERARFIVASMTGNVNFTTPSPALTVITANVNSLEAASIVAAGGGKDETAAMRTKEVILDLSLKALCSYTEVVANANFLTAESVILSAGFGTRKQPSPRANGFRISQGEHPGEMMIKTDSEPRTFFTFQRSLTPDVEESWQEIYCGMKCSFYATGLESGQRHYFRFSKANTKGRGGWSHVLDAVVL